MPGYFDFRVSCPKIKSTIKVEGRKNLHGHRPKIQSLMRDESFELSHRLPPSKLDKFN